MARARVDDIHSDHLPVILIVFKVQGSVNVRNIIQGQLAIHPSVSLSVHLSICCLSIHPSVRLSVRQSVSLPACLSVRPSVCLSVCLSVCPSIRLSVSLSVCLSLFLHLTASLVAKTSCTFASGETNLDALMTSLITAVEEHSLQVEAERKEEVREECPFQYKTLLHSTPSKLGFLYSVSVWHGNT